MAELRSAIVAAALGLFLVASSMLACADEGSGPAPTSSVIGTPVGGGGGGGDSSVDGSAAAGGDSTALPEGSVTLVVKDTAGVRREHELVQNGVPLPRASAVTNTAQLALRDDAGQPVPADFRVLSRWDAGQDEETAPLQWLLVSFLARVPANGQAKFQLLLAAPADSNPAPAVPLALEQSGDSITVNTGAASFVLGGSAGAIFDEIRDAGGALVASAGTMTIATSAAAHGHGATRSVLVEHAGPLTASVLVDGAYDLPAQGGGGIGSRRRYLFTAGSGTVIVRQAIAWEGRLCADTALISCDGQMNALLLEQARNTLPLAQAPQRALVVGDRAEPGAITALASGDEVALVQSRRASRESPLSFSVELPGQTPALGVEATGGMLAVHTSGGGLALGLRQMHRYEPQALRLLDDGSLAVDLAADGVWLGNRQGLHATIGVSVLPAGSETSSEGLQSRLWGALNRPLRAWPDAAWFHHSGVVEELPVGELPADLAAYDRVVSRALDRTQELVSEKGLSGLMTFGLFPRYWGTNDGDELDCAEDDPTPGELWDDAYWCGTWTDYHNTSATSVLWAMRSGEVEWLDEIAIPAALRSLHTQILQCAPEDDFFYCGQAPAGYRGYRSDFNSSHAYFQNLMLYYFLTGDGLVVDTLARGAETMRRYLCDERGAGGDACGASNASGDPLVGRVVSQWQAVFRFVGLTGDDPSFLDDWSANLGRAATQNFAQLTRSDRRYGFWTGARLTETLTDVQSDQLWMSALYDMRNLYRLQLDSDDAPIGDPAVRPSEIIASWARSVVDYGASVRGDGSAEGEWSNSLFFDGQGARVGGELLEVRADTASAEPFLYDAGKACLVAALARAGRDTNDPALTSMAAELVQLVFDAIEAEDAPLGKTQGEYLTQLHAAVGILASPPAKDP